MRLALYSDQEIPANGSIDERLIRLIGVKQPRIGYISSAPDPQRAYFKLKRSYYARMGAELVVYFDSESKDIESDMKILAGCDAIHLSGGNTFTFLGWLRSRGIMPLLRSYAAEDRGVLIGVSAGAILMTPTVETAALCGDERPAEFKDVEALGLVDFYFWPHYRGDTGSGISLDPGRRIYGCEDGTGIIVDGASVELHDAALLPAAGFGN